MVLSQKQVPIYGKSEIWQVLVEYEPTGKSPALLTGYRIEWQAGLQAERLVGQSIQLELILLSGDQRKKLDQAKETVARRCRVERLLKTGAPVQHGEVVQVRAKFPAPLQQAQVVLF